LSGVPEEDWCTCEPKVTVDGKEYPPAAKFELPIPSWLKGIVGGGGGSAEKKEDGDKQEL
jgi:hypothetical protein